MHIAKLAKYYTLSGKTSEFVIKSGFCICSIASYVICLDVLQYPGARGEITAIICK